MPEPHDPRQNHLLAALPAEDRKRLLPHLELVPMPLGHVLYESGSAAASRLFPDHLHRVPALRHGAMAPRPRSPWSATTASSASPCSWAAKPRPTGPWCKAPATPTGLQGTLLKQEFNRSGELQHLLLRYTQALLTQMAQTAVCNRHHSLDQQLCRWLLLALDRLPADELMMTQELIANMLGVRREGVTEAAGKCSGPA